MALGELARHTMPVQAPTVNGVWEVTGTTSQNGAETLAGTQTVTGLINITTGKINAPYGTAAPGTTTLNANGGVMVAGTQRIYFKSNGTTYFINASGTLG